MKPLTEELLEWKETWQRRLVENDLASGEASIITIAERAVGWVHVRETEGDIKLLQLYIVPEMQNRGIGSTIIRQLIDRSQDQRRVLCLEVMTNNRARALYERLGFIKTGESAYKLQMTWRGEGER